MDYQTLSTYIKLARAGYQKYSSEVPGYTEIEGPTQNGFARVYESNSEVVISIQGTELSHGDYQYWTAQGAAQYEDMRPKFAEVAAYASANNKTLVFVGHSQGGWEAQMGAIEFVATARISDS